MSKPDAQNFEDDPKDLERDAWIITVWLIEVQNLPRGISGDLGGLAVGLRGRPPEKLSLSMGGRACS